GSGGGAVGRATGGGATVGRGTVAAATAAAGGAAIAGGTAGGGAAAATGGGVGSRNRTTDSEVCVAPIFGIAGIVSDARPSSSAAKDGVRSVEMKSSSVSRPVISGSDWAVRPAGGVPVPGEVARRSRGGDTEDEGTARGGGVAAGPERTGGTGSSPERDGSTVRRAPRAGPADAFRSARARPTRRGPSGARV